MPAEPTDRVADTRVPIHPPIAQRWSPRAFDATAVLSPEQVTGLLEAARWAATWGRRQPVRFIVGVRGKDAPQPQEEAVRQTFDTLAGLLSRGNAYARAAGALILVCADEGDADVGADDATARYAAVDAGAAAANLAIEAVARGLVSHPMAGFDADGARAAFGIPTTVRPLMVIAVGSLADYATVAPEVADRDRLPRERKPLGEVAFTGDWGEALTPGSD